MFANGPGDRGSREVVSYQSLKKWYLMPPCLALRIIRWGSRVTWSNPGNGVAPSPTPRCSSYWKRSLRVTLDYGRQLYLLTHIRRWENSLSLSLSLFYKHAHTHIEEIHKTTTVIPEASYRTNYPMKTTKTCWALLEKQGRTVTFLT